MKKRKYIKLMSIMLVFLLTFSLNIDINIGNNGTSSSPNKHFVKVGMQEVEAAPGDVKLLGELPLGSMVYDPTWTWEYKTGYDYTGTGDIKPIEWLVVAKNHTEYPNNSVTLLSKDIIGLYYYDNSYNNTTLDYSGKSRWRTSNGTSIFLNNTFYNAFGKGFKDSVLNTTIPTAYFVYDSQATYLDWRFENVSNNIFLPSDTELNNVSSPITPIGSPWLFFQSGGSRATNSHYSTRGINVYWSGNKIIEKIIGIDINGNISEMIQCWPGSLGVRPALNMINNVKVKEISTGKYAMLFNSSPTINLSQPAHNSPLQALYYSVREVV